ncbi:M48 family metalloprotease [Paenibacillus periandrae]|uniref:M48 family metalloprotease n=1 Tax=Paenibacillus periandrae TaxID=1761741 RepID=UPI001F09E6A8|nr:M48 family metalloprotease [Paenibacillus periandrae]
MRDFDFFINKLEQDVADGITVKHGKGRIRFIHTLMWIAIIMLATVSAITFGAAVAFLPAIIAFQLICSIIFLWTSRIRIKKQLNIRLFGVIDGVNLSKSEREEKINTITVLLCKKLKIKKVPQLGVHYDECINAFATGPSRNKGLISFTSKSMEEETDESIVATIGHELAHIANGDMTASVLIQGFVSSLLFVFSLPIRVLIWLANWFFSNVDYAWIGAILSFIMTLILDFIIFSITRLIVLAHSRRREFRADLLSAKLVGKDSMINCLEFLRGNFQPTIHPQTATMNFIGPERFLDIFSTHPSIIRRINYVNKKLKEKE